MGDERGQTIIGDRQSSLFQSVLSVPVAERIEVQGEDGVKKGLIGMGGIEFPHTNSLTIKP